MYILLYLDISFQSTDMRQHKSYELTYTYSLEWKGSKLKKWYMYKKWPEYANANAFKTRKLRKTLSKDQYIFFLIRISFRVKSRDNKNRISWRTCTPQKGTNGMGANWKSYMYREVLRIRECKMHFKHEKCVIHLQKANIYRTHKHKNVGWDFRRGWLLTRRVAICEA